MTYDKGYAKEVLGADCDNCPLDIVGRFVPSVGPEQADLAIVGEAPGVQEARGGVPFVGPSGKLLDMVIKHHGIKREEVLLSNACLCRPPDNSTPGPAAIAACRPRLLRELGQRGVDQVLALGNTAARSLLGAEGILKLRVGPGRVSPYALKPNGDGLRVVPTVHPAACLRQSDMFPSLVTDVGKLARGGVAHEPWIEPEYDVLDDELEAVSFLSGLQARGSLVAVDIEVDIDKDTSFDHPNRYGLLCVGIAEGPERVVVIGEEACRSELVRQRLGEALSSCRIIAQNGKFDLGGLFPVCGPLKLHFDTMLAHYATDERPGHGLKLLAVELLGAPQYDEEIKKYVGPRDGYGVIPRDLLYKYNAYDVACTYRLYELFRKRLDGDRRPDWWDESFLGRVYDWRSLAYLHDDVLVPASNELMFMELNGLTVDLAYNSELAKGYVETLSTWDEKLAGHLRFDLAEGDPEWLTFNPRSPQQVKKALGAFGVRVESTAEDIITRLIDHVGRPKNELQEHLLMFCNDLLKQRKEQKLYGTYVKGIRKRLYGGRVYSTYNLHTTTSGRLSSRNPNLQNITRSSLIKRQFVPSKPENVFLEGDYAQAELRILCWLAQDPFLQAILNDPSRDLFDELWPRLYPNLPAFTEVAPGIYKDTRVRIKAFVYGLGYGRTEFSIAMEYGIPVSEAVTTKNRFFETIPDVVKWQQTVRQHVRSGKDLITPFGRHRRFWLITDDNWKEIQNEALAFLPQSTSSDVCLRAYTRLRPKLKGKGYIRNIVHDSLLVECHNDPDTIAEVKATMESEMVKSGQDLCGDYVQFRADIKVGPTWGDFE